VHSKQLLTAQAKRRVCTCKAGLWEHVPAATQAESNHKTSNRLSSVSRMQSVGDRRQRRRGFHAIRYGTVPTSRRHHPYRPRGCRYFKNRDTRLPRVWNMNLMLTVPHAALWARLLPDARVIHYTIFKASARCPEQNVSMQGLLP